MFDIPPLLPPERTPPIRTPGDLHRQWRAFMGPLGFGSRTLWMLFLAPDGRIEQPIPQIGDLPLQPRARLVRNLLGVCAMVLDDLGGGGSVAFLLARPGPPGLTDHDRAWEQALGRAAAEERVRLQPFHVATPAAVIPVQLPDAA